MSAPALSLLRRPETAFSTLRWEMRDKREWEQLRITYGQEIACKVLEG